MRLRDERVVELENISTLLGLLAVDAVAAAVMLVDDRVDGLMCFETRLSATAHVLGRYWRGLEVAASDTFVVRRLGISRRANGRLDLPVRDQAFET